MSDTTRKANDPFALQPDFSQSTSDLFTSTPTETPQVESEPQQGSALGMLLRELVETVVLSLIIFLLIRQVIQNYRIESHSMEPNFHEGEFILVNKLAFKFGQPTRGEVIVFHNPTNNDEDYIKRVIGLPGDKIEIHDQTVLINDKVLEEPFSRNPFRAGENFGPEIVPPNHLFVMGDNRGNSSDSRRIGPISEDLVVGKAWLRVWPLPTSGFVEHFHLEPGVSATAQSEQKTASP